MLHHLWPHRRCCVIPAVPHQENGHLPFGASYYGQSTLWMEHNVLNYYASLWHAKWPHDPKDPESYWGYTLTMGSSEGNLYAIYGMHVTTSLESTQVEILNFPNVPSPIITTSNVHVLQTIQMLFVLLRSIPVKPTTLS